MRVQHLDHINVVTADLDGSARFYQQMLGLERRDAPPPLTPQQAQWMHDDQGRAIIHLNSPDCPRAFPRGLTAGPTGPIHHIALACQNYAAMLQRVSESGLLYEINLIAAIGLRQIFLTDPNGVVFELNFFGD